MLVPFTLQEHNVKCVTALAELPRHISLLVDCKTLDCSVNITLWLDNTLGTFSKAQHRVELDPFTPKCILTFITRIHYRYYLMILKQLHVIIINDMARFSCHYQISF